MTLTKDKRIACRNIDGRLFLVSPWDHKLHKFNETGTMIWNFIGSKSSVNNIANKISKQFKISRTKTRQDIAQFIKLLIKKGLIHAG